MSKVPIFLNIAFTFSVGYIALILKAPTYKVKMTVVPEVPTKLSIQTLQQPRCTPPQGCKLSITGLPTATWVMEQTGPVKATIEGSTDPALIENLPDGVYRFRVAGPAGCMETPPFGAISITY